jgi:hypothetical protein
MNYEQNFSEHLILSHNRMHDSARREGAIISEDGEFTLKQSSLRDVNRTRLHRVAFGHRPISNEQHPFLDFDFFAGQADDPFHD